MEIENSGDFGVFGVFGGCLELQRGQENKKKKDIKFIKKEPSWKLD